MSSRYNVLAPLIREYGRGVFFYVFTCAITSPYANRAAAHAFYRSMIYIFIVQNVCWDVRLQQFSWVFPDIPESLLSYENTFCFSTWFIVEKAAVLLIIENEVQRSSANNM